MRFTVTPGPIPTRDLPARARAGAERGLDLALEHILRVSRARVPLEEGTLERSGATARVGLTGAVGYDTPYAVRQHEDLTLRHDQGRQAKYLESAITDTQDEVGQLIATQLRRAIGTE